MQDYTFNKLFIEHKEILQGNLFEPAEQQLSAYATAKIEYTLSNKIGVSMYTQLPHRFFKQWADGLFDNLVILSSLIYRYLSLSFLGESWIN